ncbi:MAG TPA: BON domain-containing protein [Thermoanaerobaculia bacterium]
MTGRRDDRDTRQKVERELERAGLGILHVEVFEGRVTLSGAVDSYAKKLAARDAAHRGAGVSELTDDVQVRLPGTSLRTDSEVEAAARRALEWDVFVPERRIRLFVRKGRVRLEGEVDYAWQREDAARVVRHLSGVEGIENRIRVRDLAAVPGTSGPALDRP